MLTSEAIEGAPPAVRRYKPLRTIEEVFDLIGKHEMCELTGKEYTAVCNWLHLYRRIPSRLYLRVQNDLKRRGYIADPALFRME